MTAALVVGQDKPEEPSEPHPHGPWEWLVEKYDANGDGQISIEEYSQMIEDRFARLDRNDDNVLTAADFEGRRRGPRAGKRFAKRSRHRGLILFRVADNDSSGDVSAEELSAFLASLPLKEDGAIDGEALMASLRERLGDRQAAPRPDGPREGAGRHSERRFAGEPGAMAPRPLDLDGDGTFAVADLQQLFTKLDKNEDGALQAEELHPRGQRRRGMGR